MDPRPLAPAALLHRETRALLERLSLARPFALTVPMVPAAAVSPAAQRAIERFLRAGRRELRERVLSYLRWLEGAEGRAAPAEEAHRRYAFLRLRFNAVLAHVDIFSDVLTQRGEHGAGTWLAGLDAAAADGLAVPGVPLPVPPVVCYLDRGPGAAIRRVHTRMPGGGRNPVAVIRVPRERMVGAGIASSLVHEAGHQGAWLLDLLPSLRAAVRARGARAGDGAPAWRLWERWISEIAADFWAVGRVGVVSTLGLVGVVSLPRPFVLRENDDDCHPTPYVRVLVSAAVGAALYPDPQWGRIARLWRSFYPLEGDDGGRAARISLLLREIAPLVEVVATHRPPALRGATLASALASPDRSPAALRALLEAWRDSPAAMEAAPPTLALAAVGQGRFDGRMEPEEESRTLTRLFTAWALRNALGGPEAPRAPPAAATAPRTA